MTKMAKIYFMISVFLQCNSILLVIAQNNKSANWTSVIETFANMTNGDVCSNMLRNISQQLSSNVNRNFLDTWKSTTPYEIYSLNFFHQFGEDMKCKMNRPAVIDDDWSNRYCLYEIYNDNLTDGFLFTVCIPPSCTVSDVELLGALVHSRDGNQRNSDKSANTQCSRRAILDTCHDSRVGVVAFISVLPVALAFVGSIVFKLNQVQKRTDKTLLSNTLIKFGDIFSIQSSVVKLMASNAKTDINILHPMRVFSMLMIIFGHVYQCTLIFAENVDDFQNTKLFLWQILSNFTVSVGTFFIMAGTLTNYVTLCKFSKKEKSTKSNENEHMLTTIKRSIIPWSIMIVNRYIRIICLYLFFYLTFTFSIPHILFLIQFVNFDSSVQCPPRFLKHILMLSNFDYRQYCMMWVWHVAVDFQLFVLNRPVIWLYVYKPLWALVASLFLVVGSCITRILLMLSFDFPPSYNPVVPFPQYNLNWFLYYFEIYTKPWSWWSSYAIGMIIGYAAFYLRFKRTSFKLQPSVQTCLWICAISFFLWAYLGVFWNANGFKNSTYDAFYTGFSPICWALACGWVIIHSHSFLNVNFIQKFYKMKFFTIISNLTYGCFFLNMPIGYCVMSFYTYIIHGQPRIYLSFAMLCILFVATIIISYLISFYLYVIIEGPCSYIRIPIPKTSSKSEEMKSRSQPECPLVEQRSDHINGQING